jgi:capsular polysaccharide biosynthesis protein
VLAAGLGAVAVSAQTPTYFSEAALLIDQPRAIAESPNEGIVVKLSRLRAKYTGLVGTSRIAGPVAQALDLPERSVANALVATADPLSLLLTVSARTSDAALSRRIAQAAAERLAEYVREEQEADKIPPAQRFSLFIVDAASPPLRISPTGQRRKAVAAVAGLMAIGAAYVILRWRSA